MKIMIKHAPTSLYVGGDFPGDPRTITVGALRDGGFVENERELLKNVMGIYPCVWEVKSEIRELQITEVSDIIKRRHGIVLLDMLDSKDLVVEDGSLDDDDDEEEDW